MRADRMRREGQLHRRRGKAADAGFSLVELLIAVTILAIIVIPLLHLFVTSTRINVKSRQTLRATTVAQDIMEGLKAYTLEEVRTQFNTQDENGKFVLADGWHYPEEGFYILSSDMIKGDVCELTELETWLDKTTGKPKANDPNNETYYFGIRDLKMQGGEYNALIKLDASTYTEAKAGEDAKHNNAFNGKYYADVMSVAETNGTEIDSSYHEPAGLYQDVLKDIKTQVEDDYTSSGTQLPENWDEEWEKIGIEDIVTAREILVEIEPMESSGGLVTDKNSDSKCQARTTFTYTCKCPLALNPDKSYTSHGWAGGNGEVIAENTLRQFSSGNFYLFYYPIYKLGLIDDIKFSIKDGDKLFNGETPILRSITLAKQIRSTVDTTANVIAPDMSDHDLYIAEGRYQAKCNITMDHTPENNHLVFRTNIDTNISKEAQKNNIEDDDTIWDNIQWSYDPGVIDVVAMAGNEVSSEPMNVIYDIEITVYEYDEEEKDQFGKPDFEDSANVHKLATITNLD